MTCSALLKVEENFIPKLDIPVIATIGQKLRHKVKDDILQIPKIKIFKVSYHNQRELYSKILALIPLHQNI